MTTKDYARLIRRHLWLIVVVVGLSSAAVYFYFHVQVPLYAATAQLLYQPAIDVTGSSSTYVDPNAQQLQVEAAAATIVSPAISDLVATAIGPTHSWPGYSVVAYAASSNTGTASFSTGINVRVSSTNPDFAAKMANAYAKEFIEWRLRNQRATYAEAADLVKTQLNQLTTPAQQQSTQHDILQRQLQYLEMRAATVTGDFAVVVPATAPSAPYAPRPIRSALLAAGVGLIVALGLAFSREKLDTRVRDHHEVVKALGLPVVGRIPPISKATLDKAPLVIVEDPDGAPANAFRLIRTNLEFVSLGAAHRTIMMVSALKEEGKSLTIANLAASLSLNGERTLLIDADLRRPQVHHLYGLPNRYGVSTVLAGQVDIDDAVRELHLTSSAHSNRFTLSGASPNRHQPSLSLLPAGPPPPNPGEMIASHRFAVLLEKLKARDFEHILIDSPAFLSVGDASALAALTDGLVVVVNLKTTRRPVLDEIKEFLDPLPVRKLGIIIVGDRTGRDERYQYRSERRV